MLTVANRLAKLTTTVETTKSLNKGLKNMANSWIGIKVHSISQRQKPNLRGLPSRGVILETTVRKTMFGESIWAKVEWTNSEGSTWQDWSPLSDFVDPQSDFVKDGHICGDRSEV